MTLLDEEVQRWYCYKDDEIYLAPRTATVDSSGSERSIPRNFVVATFIISAMGFLSVVLSAVLPLDLIPSVRSDVFRTLAEVGGVLIGFIGIVGVYGLDSIRSRISDNSKRVGQLQGEYRRLEPKLIQLGQDETRPGTSVALTTIDFQIDALREQRKQFENDFKLAVGALFTSVMFSFVTIVSAIFGISGVNVPIPLLGWRVLVFLNFFFLFASIYFIALLIVMTTGGHGEEK